MYAINFKVHTLVLSGGPLPTDLEMYADGSTLTRLACIYFGLDDSTVRTGRIHHLSGEGEQAYRLQGRTRVEGEVIRATAWGKAVPYRPRRIGCLLLLRPPRRRCANHMSAVSYWLSVRRIWRPPAYLPGRPSRRGAAITHRLAGPINPLSRHHIPNAPPSGPLGALGLDPEGGDLQI